MVVATSSCTLENEYTVQTVTALSEASCLWADNVSDTTWTIYNYKTAKLSGLRTELSPVSSL